MQDGVAVNLSVVDHSLAFAKTFSQADDLSLISPVYVEATARKRSHYCTNRGGRVCRINLNTIQLGIADSKAQLMTLVISLAT